MGSKPFQGLVFCPTSVPSSVSLQICKKIEKLGGTFTKDLTRLVNVLVCGELFTPKYNFAIQNRTDIVFVKPDCIMALYNLWMTGQDLLQLSENSMITYIKRNYSIAPFELFNIFIGRINIEGPEYSMQQLVRLCELGKVRRLDTQHYIRNVENVHPTIFITDNLSGHRVRAAIDENVPVVHPKWIIDCMDRYGTLDYNKFYLLKNCQDLVFDDIGKGSYIKSESMPSALKDEINGNKAVSGKIDPSTNSLKISREKFKPQANQIWGNLLSKDESNLKNREIEKKTNVLSVNSMSEVSSAIFENCHFFLYAFNENQRSILEKVISQNKGLCSVFNESTHINKEERSFFICSSGYSIIHLPSATMDDTNIENSWLTEFYIERCLYYGTLLEPDYWAKPFYNTFRVIPPTSICHGEKLSFHITGFHGVELLHINKMVSVLKVLGFEQHEKLSTMTDILIVNISQLTSIPSEHPLRKNKYASMSRTDLELKISQKQAQMFRNSMKRKIEFVKNSHQIPILTASFIVELFQRSKKLASTIYFNDVNWCISCPKGSKSDFSLEITSPQNSNEVDTKLDEKKLISSESSLSESYQPNISKRSKRWGNLLSNTIDTQKEYCDPQSQVATDQESTEVSSTQITYGLASSSVKKRKVVTRSQLKQIIS